MTLSVSSKNVGKCVIYGLTYKGIDEAMRRIIMFLILRLFLSRTCKETWVSNPRQDTKTKT